MIEVMMVGVLVALVKIADYATVIPDWRYSCSGYLSSSSPGMSASFDSRDVWERIQWADEAQRDAAGETLTEGTVMSSTGNTAMQQGSAKLRRLRPALASRAG